MKGRRPLPPAPNGFTLVELLVSCGIVVGIVIAMASMVNATARIWRQTTAKTEQFRESRAAFENITRRLSQATLNTYWDYDSDTNPSRYLRRSELRFISGAAADLIGGGAAPHLTQAVFFVAPLGITSNSNYRGFENLLCTWGYYLQYGDDSSLRPAFITPQIAPVRYRSRLMELSAPSEFNAIYKYTSPPPGQAPQSFQSYAGKDWFQKLVNEPAAPVHLVAENVVALILIPRLSKQDEAAVAGGAASGDLSPLAPDYAYDSSPPGASTTDSRYLDPRLNPSCQLPPILQVTLVAIDEDSAARLSLDQTTPDRFNLAGKFLKTANYSADLLATADATNSLEAELIAAHLNYRIFTTNVLIRGAKWSTDQTK